MIDPNTNTAVNAPNISNGLQVNSRDMGNLNIGLNTPGSNGTNRNSGVIEITPRTTDCTALQMAVAHEVGHGQGLGECPGCTAGASVMSPAVCASRDSSNNCVLVDFKNNTFGRTSPTGCDNQVM